MSQSGRTAFSSVSLVFIVVITASLTFEAQMPQISLSNVKYSVCGTFFDGIKRGIWEIIVRYTLIFVLEQGIISDVNYID